LGNVTGTGIFLKNKIALEVLLKLTTFVNHIMKIPMRKVFTLFFLVFSFNAAFAQFAHQNINLLGNFDDPAVQPESVYGIRYQSCWGYVDSLGNEYGIIGSTAGTYIIDVTDPTNPVQHTYIPHRQNDCIWHEYKTYENYLYIISDDGGSPTNSLQMVDLRYLPDSIHKFYDDTTIFVHSHTQYIDGDRWYVASVSRKNGNFYPMAVYSLANPESPTLLRALNQDFPNINSVHDMFVIHDTIFASCGYQGLFIFKYDEQTNQFIQLGALPGNSNNYNHSSFISKDHTTLYVCEEVPAGMPIQIVDISDIANPSVLSTFVTNAGCTPHNPYVLGDYLYVAAYSDGVWIYDISDPQNPINTGYFDSHPQNGSSYPNAYEGGWAVYTDLPSGVLLESDMQYGLFVLDKTIAVQVPQSIPSSSFISVYPNPSISDINVRMPGIRDGSVAVTLTGMDGKVVYENSSLHVINEKVTIPSAQFAAGLYTLKATTSTNNFVKRISVIK
jgi:choice-of-anchor B domain-containing protein